MVSRIQLLGPPWSRAFRNIWMLEELGVAYENLEVLPLAPESKCYVRSGKIPILLEFDTERDVKPSFVLYESSAINTYLGDKYGSKSNNKNLVPSAGTRDRAMYDQTVLCIMSELDAQGLWMHRKHSAMHKVFGDIPDAVEAARLNFVRMNKQVSEQLNPYVLGNNFTAADILYVHCLDWAKSIGWHTEWPNSIQPYRELCHARPAYQSSKAKRDINKDDRRKKESTINVPESSL